MAVPGRALADHANCTCCGIMVPWQPAMEEILTKRKEPQGDAPQSLSDEEIGDITGGAMSTQQTGTGWVVDDSDDGSVIADGSNPDRRGPTSGTRRG